MVSVGKNHVDNVIEGREIREEDKQDAKSL